MLPFALPAAAFAWAGAILAWAAVAQAWLTGVAMAAVVGAWAWIVWQSLRTRAKPKPTTLWVMGLATALLVLALSWRQIEPFIIRAIIA